MERSVLLPELGNGLLEIVDFLVLVSDDLAEVLQLLHLCQVLITLFVDGRQILMVDLLHVTQSFLEVHCITMGASKCVGQLLTQN